MRQRLAKDRSATLNVVLSTGDDPLDADALPLVTVRRADGTVLKNGVATDAAGVGSYDFALTAAELNTLGELEATWSAVFAGGPAQLFRSYYEVVGGHLVSLASLRKTDPLDDEVKYTLADLVDARDAATYALEDACNTAFARRRIVETLQGPFGKFVALYRSRDVQLVSGSWGTDPITALDAYTLGTMAPQPGGLVAVPTIVSPLSLVYEHGWQAAPQRVARAIRLLAAEWAQENIGDSALSSRTMMSTTEAGTFRYVTAGEFGRGFDLPEVNAVVQAYAE